MNTENQKEKKPFNKKKLKYGAAATAITVFVVAIVVFINLMAGILTEKKGLKLDLTSEKYFNISQDTIDYIKEIDTDVNIEVFSKKEDLEDNTYYKMVVETLAKYQQNSDHITVNYYDITENPDVVSRYSSKYNGQLSAGNIVIACGDRVKVTTVTGLFNMDSQTGSVKAYKGEQEITAAVMNVTNANPIKVAVVAMYNGESIYHADLGYAVNSLVTLLDKNGYEYTPVDILTDEISPDEYDMAVLPAPVNDLTEDCVKKLEDFLYNSGNLDKNLIYIADILQRKTPNIDAFLEVWGIKVGDNQVIESSNANIQQINVARNTYGMTQSAKAPVAAIADSSFSEGLSNTKLPIVAPAARNIELLFDKNVDRTTTALLKTSENSMLYPLEMQEAEEISLDKEDTEEATEEETEPATDFDPNSAETGENVVMALAQKTAAEGDVNHINSLMVIGGASFTDPCITGVSTFNNAEFIVNSINKICGKENTVIIAEKNFESTAISITESQGTILEYVVIFGFPIVIIVCGVVVYIRRKNK